MSLGMRNERGKVNGVVREAQEVTLRIRRKTDRNIAVDAKAKTN